MKTYELMNGVKSRPSARPTASAFLGLVILFNAATPAALAQQGETPTPGNPETAARGGSVFRMERLPVAAGAEVLTIFGSLDGLPRAEASAGGADVPLVSVLRDTLGDDVSENDRLRYVWVHTYTNPSARQRAASAVPFLYARVGNKNRAGRDVPPHLLDLGSPDRDVWRKLFLSSLQALLIDPASAAAKASTRTYRRNLDDYRRAHVVRALAVLALYEAGAGGEAVFTPQELKEIQGRLTLTQKSLGGLVDDIYLRQVEQRQSSSWLDARGHNWELLRQRAEAEGLYFEPLLLPDGGATHALLWTTREDVARNRGRKFGSRFLNLTNPWGDERLRKWDGYAEPRYFDAENRRVEEGTPGARRAEMIPLALYGLDHPKIPILLVDFRDTLSPKGREMSRRVLKDVTRTVAAFSRADLAFMLGRAVYAWMADRRGMDINQPSRVRSYSQLKLLLSLDASLDPALRDELSRRLEAVSLNPLENGREAEASLARQQYAALAEYARRPDGLGSRLDRDRRAELVPLKHGRAGQIVFKLAHTLSFGLYTHRERADARGQAAALDAGRRLDFHRRYLREVARSSSRVEVEWDAEEVRRSLRFVAEHGARADGRTAAAVARIFGRTEDKGIRGLCLGSLYRINNETAKNSLVRIYRDHANDEEWRALSARYLRRAAREEQRISQADARFIATISINE
ncbi:MAG: hypothetical protein LC800_00880 [Acidobacteria bacterium]|nr:hypothetical protein [Acidobacteriota bacterium]